MGKRGIHIFFVVLVGLAVALSVWGPEALSGYQDRSLLGKIHRQETEASGEGYRYELSAVEKVYVLSQALGSVSPAEDGGQGNLPFAGGVYRENGGNYAFVTSQGALPGKTFPARRHMGCAAAALGN